MSAEGVARGDCMIATPRAAVVVIFLMKPNLFHVYCFVAAAGRQSNHNKCYRDAVLITRYVAMSPNMDTTVDCDRVCG